MVDESAVESSYANRSSGAVDEQKIDLRIVGVSDSISSLTMELAKAAPNGRP
jgi:hypothetical protein